MSAALTHAEAPDVGLVGAVYTLPSHRGQGCAAACVAGLCADLEREGRRPCLYHEADNAPAAALYRRLGFRPVAPWHNSIAPAGWARNRSADRP